MRGGATSRSLPARVSYISVMPLGNSCKVVRVGWFRGRPMGISLGEKEQFNVHC